ncbi:MAG TPA: hypothetical protein VLE21_05210 [Candidatus Nitrosocosmicus sp.]|nr:hypothetical protein [Candidatus Nitrosocosmicus sp.]
MNKFEIGEEVWVVINDTIVSVVIESFFIAPKGYYEYYMGSNLVKSWYRESNVYKKPEEYEKLLDHLTNKKAEIQMEIDKLEKWYEEYLEAKQPPYNPNDVKE